MAKQQTDKCKATGKERDDRGVLSKNKFDTLNIEIKYPGTAILLLRSQENPTLAAAAAALSKFGSKSSENLEILFDLDIVSCIIPLIEHEEIFTRRFATKLLAEMATLPNVRDFLMSSECYIPHFTNVLQNDTDIFIHEFVTLILAELSKDMYGVAKLLNHCNNFDILFEKIQSPDPDVKKNSIEIIYNLLKDPTAAQAIVNTKDFSFPLIYELLKQSYPVIQLLTLDVINLLVARNKDENIQELFRNSRGLQTLLNILDNDEFVDLHQKVLEILSLACDNEKTVELFCSTDGIRKLLKYMESYNKESNLNLLNIIVRLANSANGRKELYKNGIVAFLLNALYDSSQPDIAQVNFYGLAKMVRYSPAAEVVTSFNPIQRILDFIKNENIKQSVKQAATYCLLELLACDAQNGFNLLDIKGQFHLIWMIKQPSNKVSVEIQITALNCLTVMGGYPELREQIIDTALIDALCAPFEFKSNFSLAETKVAYCDALSIFFIEKIARDIFLHLEGPKRLYNLLLDSESVPVRDAAARLISQLCTDEAVAPMLILAGCLEYMIKHRSASKIVPSWETCIKALFNSYLPAKFAFTGRLSLHDITKNGFYVMRQNTDQFCILDQLFNLSMNPMQTIYTCNLAPPRLPLISDSSGVDRKSIRTEEHSMLTERNSTSAGTATDDEKKRFSVYSTDVTSAIMAERYTKLEPDPFLYDLVELFKCKLIAVENKNVYEQEKLGLINICYIKSRTKMLGEFIARQMSGPDPTTKCIDHQLELHLNEIKYDIGTNIIPLGQLRVGSYLERALLFKVIADRICLPAALIRGEYGKAWIEIALPEIDVQNEEELSLRYAVCDSNKSRQVTILPRLVDKSISNHRSFENPTKESVSIHEHTSTIFPTKLLRPNYLVDLIEVPGELIPLDTKRANDYCGYQSCIS